jgi:hypothetical protein
MKVPLAALGQGFQRHNGLGVVGVQHIPEPISRAVRVLQVASVGELPICHPLAENSGYVSHRL